MTLKEALTHATLKVPVAGKVFYGLERNAAYEAARRGDLPTIKIGRLIRVPVKPVADQLGLTTNIGGEA